MQKIRKGDQVVVTTGKDKGKRGTVLRVFEAGKVAGRGREPREEAPAPQPREGPDRRHHRQGDADQHLERDAGEPGHGKGDRVGFKFLDARAGSAAQGALLQVQRRSRGRLSVEHDDGNKDKDAEDRRRTRRTPKPGAQAAAQKPSPPRKRRPPSRADGKKAERQASAPTQPPRLKIHYQRSRGAGADEAVRLQDQDAGAAHQQDHAEHGRGRGRGRQEDPRQRRRRHAARSPARSRSSPSRRSRSRASRSATAIPSARMVTLRSRRMYEFLDRLVTIALPRVRDFRGVSGRAFDGRGNYNMGIKEQIIFPEIEYDKIDALRGMNISITTTAKTDEEAKALLAAFKFPFRTERARNGQACRHQPPGEAPGDGEEIRREARSSCSRSSRTRRPPTRPATRRARSCRRCPATPRPCACATAAPSRAARAARSASSASRATRSARSRCAARSPA